MHGDAHIQEHLGWLKGESLRDYDLDGELVSLVVYFSLYPSLRNQEILAHFPWKF